MYFTANMGDVEPRLETWVRQRGKALYTADGQLGYELDDLADFFAFWYGPAGQGPDPAGRRAGAATPPARSRRR